MLGLFVIDPQNDFCDPKGSLFVPGASEDMARLHAWARPRIDDFATMIVSMDQHHVWDISHPSFWRDADGARPAPFTQITPEDLEKGLWRPDLSALMSKIAGYLKSLKELGRYSHTIWPEHCLVGSWGANLCAPIFELCKEFESRRQRPVTYFMKGLNANTEHFSVVKAEVPNPEDGHTMVNQELLKIVADPALDDVYVAGEALSHCVAATIEDLLDEAPQLAAKLVLVRNATSAVPGFEEQAREKLASFEARGVRMINVE